MAKGKIAPKVSARLRKDIAGNGTRYNLFDATLGRQAGDEVRALLAVARAAKRVEKVVYYVEAEMCGLTRALARLDRVSGGKP